ncbi:MAG: NAD(P)H-dependent oxidoreductase [Pseudonocardia sp.]|nr:NAD(P)H-dependent oxidoreductase [Pseudonocardia sp.]
MQILGIVGSLRRGSYNRMLLQAASALAPTATELIEWAGLREVPPFCEDDEERATPAVHALRAAIAAADAVLVVTPEYNGSLPGQLKNVLDWASRPFPDNVLRGKPVAVIGASPSLGGAGRAQAEARTVLARIGARVLDGEVRVPRAYEQFDPNGRLLDPGLRLEMRRLLGELATAAGPGEAVA